jgi:cation:H+ antiporter
MVWFYILIFIISCLMIFCSGRWLIRGLMGMARFLEWKEFVVAFFTIALAGAIPNFFFGITSAVHKVPLLSFGDVIGGNMIDLTVAVALAALVIKGLPADGKTIQASSLFTIVVAILPLFLILDGTLGRGDGIILIFMFVFYIFWLFSKQERFSKIYEKDDEITVKDFTEFIKNIGMVILGITFLILAAQGMIFSALWFADALNLSLVLIGILIIAIGNALPEIYFAVISARQGRSALVLGNLMGSVVVPATLVLGTVAIICPIQIQDFSPFAIGRFFLIISALFFFFFMRTDRKITKKEAMFLLGIYALFVLIEILSK